jgi:hypothetical protein
VVTVLINPAKGEKVVAVVGGEEAAAATEPCRIWRHDAEALFAGGRSWQLTRVGYGDRRGCETTAIVGRRRRRRREGS